MHVRLMNWQTASRNAAIWPRPTPCTAPPARCTSRTTSKTRPGLPGARNHAGRPAHGPSLDVFSLGCIAYHLFSGQPPAESVLDLAEKLRVGQGLRLSDVMDGCGARQQDLIQFATYPDVLGRYDTIQGFLDDLDRVEDELTTPDPEATVDPSIASTGDRSKAASPSSSDGPRLVQRRAAGAQGRQRRRAHPQGGLRHRAQRPPGRRGRSARPLHHQNIVEWHRARSPSPAAPRCCSRGRRKTLAEKIKDAKAACRSTCCSASVKS
jgi:serine/threonine protein kinase